MVILLFTLCAPNPTKGREVTVLITINSFLEKGKTDLNHGVTIIRSLSQCSPASNA